MMAAAAGASSQSASTVVGSSIGATARPMPTLGATPMPTPQATPLSAPVQETGRSVCFVVVFFSISCKR